MQSVELKINVEDELIEQIGLDSIKKYLEKAASDYQLQLIAKKIAGHLGNDSQIDDDFRQAKIEAWAEYKETYMPLHLKEALNRKEK